MPENKSGVSGEVSRQAGVYTADSHMHHSICKAFVATHQINPEYPGGEGSLSFGQYELTYDIVQCEYEETFQGQSCSLTLIPRKPYLEIIFPGDWISVYLGTGGSSPEGFGVLGRPDEPHHNDRVLVGFVDSMKRSVSTNEANGQTSVRIHLTCSGVQKAFDKTSIYYNDALGPETLFGAQMPGLSLITKNVPLIGTPATIPRAIALAFLGFGGQFLLPDSYPTGVGSLQDRSKRVISFLERSKNLEEDIGILNVRGTGAGSPQRPGIIQETWNKHKNKVSPNAITSIIDLFTYVEDRFVDGRITNTPTHDLTGSVWSKMMENVNPLMNECFFSMLPTKLDEFGDGERDEWGQYPKYIPSLVIRERPLSWRDEKYVIASKIGGSFGRRELHFGNVFFSSVENPANVTVLQRSVVPSKPKFDLDSPQGLVTISDITGLSFDIIESELKESRRKKESFDAFMIRITKRANLGVTAAESLKKRILGPPRFDEPGIGQRYIDRISIRTKDIKGESIGTSDNDMYNFFMMSNAKMPIMFQKYVFLQDGLIPIYLPESIKRYGLRVREIASKYGNAGGVRLDSKAVQNFFVRCLLAQDLWYQHNPSYLAGSFTVPGMPKAHVGMALDISYPRNETYYVEGVSHTWSHPGRLETTFTVTRGQPTGSGDGNKGRFNYAPPDPVRVYDVNGNEIVRTPLPFDQQPTYVAKGPIEDSEFVKAINAHNENVPGAQRVDLATFQNIKTEAAKEKKAVLEYLKENNLISNSMYNMLTDIKARDALGADPIKRKVPAKVEVKRDRVQAGRIAWLEQPELHGKMWDPVRRRKNAGVNNSGIPTDDLSRIEQVMKKDLKKNK